MSKGPPLGQLLYGSPPVAFELPDRTLSHVEIVVLAKLRRNEPFALSIDLDDGGRASLWISVNSDLQFLFGPGKHEINRTWLEQLVDSANTTGGMRILPEV